MPEEEELESSLVGGSELDKEEGLIQACPDGEGSGLPNILSLQATKKEVEQWQHEDQTLVRVRELAHPEGAGHEGILLSQGRTGLPPLASQEKRGG